MNSNRLTKSQKFQPPLIIAHRGSHQAFPENTMEAFDAALREGAEGIELDVQLTRDGVPVVYHDRSLRRLGFPHRRIYRMTAKEVSRLDFMAWQGPKAPCRIPTLQSVLSRLHRKTRLYIELKKRGGAANTSGQTRLVREVLNLLRAFPAAYPVTLVGFHWEMLEKAKRTKPSLKILLNGDSVASLKAACRKATFRPDALGLDIRQVTPSFLSWIKHQRFPLFVFPCASRASLRQASAIPLAGMITDQVPLALQARSTIR